MKQYKETRKIFADDLRVLCVAMDWYTCGTNEEYRHLLYDLAQNKENVETMDIIEIAQDIMEHSVFDNCYSISSIAFEVSKIAVSFFEEA